MQRGVSRAVALPTLAVVGLVNALTAATFAAVGTRLLGRAVPAEDRFAMRALTVWWWCMGLFLALQAALAFAGVLGLLAVPAFTAVRYLSGPLLATGSWGLCFHILYLATGRQGLAVLLGVYFAAVAVAYDASTFLHPIVALMPTAWEVTPAYSPPLQGDPLWTAVLAGVGLPLIAACLTYLGLVGKLEARAQKRRVVLVSSGILLWVATGLAAQLAGGPLARFFTITVLGLLAALAVFLAYFPPAWLGRRDPPPRLRVGEEAIPPPPPPSSR
jgi:hypothetical protein